MPEYRVTFGSQYGSPEFGRGPHPVLAYGLDTDPEARGVRDGWVTIVAPSEEAATFTAQLLFGETYSRVYDARSWRGDAAESFPRGELLRIVHPGMADLPVHRLTAALPQTHYVTPNGPAAGRLLVTVWGAGTGEVAWREHAGDVWGPPEQLTPTP